VRSIRLLPVVIFAAVALLLFKGIGLLTSGGYVLVGTTEISAAGGGGHSAPAANTGGDATMAMPIEPTMEDEQPTIDDSAPTLAPRPEAGDHGEPAAGDHGEQAASAEAVAPGEEAAPAADHGTAPPAETAAGDHGAPAAETSGETPAVDVAKSETDPRAEGIPMLQKSVGESVPLVSSDGVPFTEKEVLTRLAERRAELDAFATELEMRMALVEAAEKRLDERKTALEALEARINALVAEKKAMEEGEFKALVGMYETMKPGEAAPIFDKLQMNVLVRLARSMNPRKMAPILAKMSADRAEQLTIAMAALEDAAAEEAREPGVASLPQIVGQ
jgi:flagellar motility protein MotE (MotC chaperone)